jgi:hypothetical protein
VSLCESWEKVRAACELLHDLATVQHENGNHPDAGVVVQWLDHVGRVAATQAQRGAQAPHGEYLQ